MPRNKCLFRWQAVYHSLFPTGHRAYGGALSLELVGPHVEEMQVKGG